MKTVNPNILNSVIGAKSSYLIVRLDNFEWYRKYHYCPIKGCKPKSLEKLSNHFVSIHKIVDAAERD